MLDKANNQPGILPVEAQNIPEKLKKINNWVVWEAVENGSGKFTKVPKNPRTGKNASTNAPDTWGTFEEALTYYERHKGQIDGIGFVFTKEDSFWGIDLDNCRDPETGDIEPWASQILEEINSYSEISPSGKGVKIFCEGTLPCLGRKFDNIELYKSGRYFTVTGETLKGFPLSIEERSKEGNALYQRLNAAKSSGITKRIEPASTFDLVSLPVSFGTKRLIRDGEQKGKRSEAIMSVVDSLVKAGIPDGTIFQIFEEYPIGEKYREKGASKERWLRSHIEKAKEFTKSDETLIFPSHIMSGVAGEFAQVYGSVLETPREFLFMAFLTGLGTLLANKVTLDSELKIQPRLYTLFLGRSADARKSTAIDVAIDFFQGYSKEFEVCRGVGSAEGLQKRLERTDGGLLLVQDELSQLTSKGKVEASVLIPMINTLFDSNSYENQTKNSGIRLDKAYLSILAASTTDTYERIWTPSLIAIGFPNRILIVPGEAQRKIAIPRKVSEEEKRGLMVMVDELVKHVGRYRELGLTDEANELYNTWYSEKESSLHSLRLDTISLRLMILLSINELKPQVDGDIVRKVIDLANWQLKARKFYDPIDADTIIAKMEEKIRRKLSTGPKTDRTLRQDTNARRTGAWVYETARNNLKRAGEIVSNGKPEKWRLVTFGA